MYEAFGVKQRSSSFFRSSHPFVRLGDHPFIPTRASLTSVGRRTNLAACSAFARPHLDSFEHDGTLDAIGMTIRGEPAFGRGSIAPQPCIRWVQEPDHDAAMRIGSEAPRRRAHSSSRHDSHESPRDPATSNRHRRVVTSGRIGPKLSGVFSDLRSLRRGAVRRRPAPRPPAPAATGRSEACAPRPRSWFCECRGRSRCALETTAPRRSPSGT